ncbi:MAG TPA: HD domain-containing protein, partial [Burkholderiales bacterium]|nr:HD domain-containing protein [Burkholderiales bacterium]
MTQWFSNDLDVARIVRTTDAAQVNAEVDRIFRELYPDARTDKLDSAFSDALKMYRGDAPGFHACDTAYHDIQHVLEVTLAMARLIDGYERSRVGLEPIGERLFNLGVITALFHDIGYLRRPSDPAVETGAAFTLVHVSRGANFLREYLPRIGMQDMADVAAELIHFTGYEKQVGGITVPGLVYRLLGNLLGSADIIAQMADRCYLEKCRDRLYPEFLAGGLARRTDSSGKEIIVYSSGADLVHKTPNFYQGAARRLNEDLQGGFNYAERHFGGQNLYLEEVAKNIQFAKDLADDPELTSLKRIPPDT